MAGVSANEVTQLSPIEIRAQVENLEGLAISGSEGVVSGQRLATVPLQRPGEALEMVPGLIVTQHAGDGKANQYFLRGFNLDHGTDFATWVAGMPVNMPTHAHGQGYTDLNFLIPELVSRIRYRKGPYFADEGDFSSVGVARIDYLRRLDGTLATLTAGQNGYARALLAGSPVVGDGSLLYALESSRTTAPGRCRRDYRKLNGVLRYSQGTRENGWAVTGMAYRGKWTSTDQIAERAIDSGLVDRFGTLDDSTGGDTSRYSLSAEWARRGENSQTTASAWWLRSSLDLWSNFQYCLNDYAATGTCDTGDQFKQGERRKAGGFSAAHTLFDRWGGFDVANSFGVDGRSDHISPVGLYNTQRRVTWNTYARMSSPSAACPCGRRTRRAGPTGSARRSASVAMPTTLRSRQPAGQFGQGQRPDGDAQAGADLRTLAAYRVLSQLRPGFPFQRRARHDHPRRPDRRHDAGHPGFAAGANHRLRGRPAQRAAARLADDAGALAAEHGFRAPIRRRRRYDRAVTPVATLRRRVEQLHAANAWLAFDADLAWSHARFSESAPEGDYIPAPS